MIQFPRIKFYFKDFDHENECRKYKVTASKVMKRKFKRKAHQKIIADDGLREVDILTPKLSKRKCIY